jgi:hypothetical protein
MSAAAMKIGVVKMRIIAVKKSGVMLIRSVSALRNAGGLKSEDALMRSASARQRVSQRERRMIVLLLRGIARKRSSVLVIDGLIAPRWLLEPFPTLLLPDLMM